MKMIKTYISALMVMLLAGAQTVQSQESMDDVLAQLDGTYNPGGQSAAPAEAVAAAESSSDVVPAVGDGLEALYKKGNAYYQAGDFDNAKLVYEAVLAEDPYYSRATTMLKRTAKKIHYKESAKKDTVRAQAITDIKTAWNQEPKVLIDVDVADGSASDNAEALAIQQMETRLKDIMIPSLDFRDAAIEDVLLFLAEASRRNDAGQDVDFLLVGMQFATGDSDITISIRDMSLYDALQFVVEMASLKFVVKPNIISVMPLNYVPVSEMVMETYAIIPEVGEDLESAAGDGGGGADDLFGEASSSESSTAAMDVSGFFSSNVDFPEGASAIYHPRFHKLFVKNSPANIKGIEGILAELNEKAVLRRSQQVEIEAKFVEFNEGSMEELGFDWSMFGSGTVASMGMDPRGVTDGTSANTATIDPNTGQVIGVDQNNRPGQNLFGGSQRDNTAVFASVASGILSSMGGSPAAMLFSNGDIDLQITALEQEGTADVLSAPKVTTKSGSEATIRVAETHRYPQDYDVETGQRTSPVVKPQDWEDFDLGVTLKVTPVVNPENNTIDLDLYPEIMKIRGFDQYLVGFNAFDSSGGNTPDYAGDGSALYAEMPFFERRSVQTQVTIADGQTVVMGGLVDERTQTFRDQIPFLGDIPYLGRLFRTEGSRSSKRNLVIYVKATMVDEFGMSSTQRDMRRQAMAD